MDLNEWSQWLLLPHEQHLEVLLPSQTRNLNNHNIAISKSCYRGRSTGRYEDWDRKKGFIKDL